VKSVEIFSGRIQQLRDALSIVEQGGLHALLFGERGVGKTSMANIIQILAQEPDEGHLAIKVECTSSDTFRSIIAGFYREIYIERAIQEVVGFHRSRQPSTERVSLFSLVSEKTSFNPKDVASLFEKTGKRLLLILDEFDRLNRSLFEMSDFTELLKILSDKDINAHFLVVGVGESVEQIIGSHASIVRNLEQIKLGEMTPVEIRGIVTRGLEHLTMTMHDVIVSQIIDISCGYPHYTHLMCAHACSNAIRRRAADVQQADLEFAISRSISKAQESLNSSYHAATMANKPNIYKEVLQACGNAKLDDYGTFQPRDVEKPLSLILKWTMRSPQFGSHLLNLCRPERGEILQLVGEKGRNRTASKTR